MKNIANKLFKVVELLLTEFQDQKKEYSDALELTKQAFNYELLEKTLKNYPQFTTPESLHRIKKMCDACTYALLEIEEAYKCTSDAYLAYIKGSKEQLQEMLKEI
jgi:hypothetical protein